MTREPARCAACGASLAEDSVVCPVCGKPHGGGALHTAQSGQGAATPVEFRPAPHIPAPLKAARPGARFTPVAGMIVGGRKKGLLGRRRRRRDAAQVVPETDERLADEDAIPAWVYKTGLVVVFLGMVGAYFFWTPTSDIFTPFWKLWALALLVTYAIVGLIIFVRLGRKQRYGTRVAHTAVRARQAALQGSVKAVKGSGKRVARTGRGMVNAARGIKTGGAQFAEGFQSTKEPNFIVKGIRGVFRFFVKIIIGVLRLVIGVFRLVYRIYVGVVQLLWATYRGIVEPVLLLAFRIVRWALKVSYRVLRWALRVVWRVFYWLVRRWPIKYVTNALEAPVRGVAEPRVLTTNVVIADALGAPVKAPVRARAEPYVAHYRLKRQTVRAEKLLAKEEARVSERELWLTIPTPQEKRALREEKKRRKADEAARRMQAKLDEKEARKQGERERKEARKEIKALKKDGREVPAELYLKAGMSLPEELSTTTDSAPPAAAEDKDKKRRKAKKEKDQAKEDAGTAPGPGPAAAPDETAGPTPEPVAAAPPEPEPEPDQKPKKAKKKDADEEDLGVPTVEEREAQLGRKLTKTEKKALKNQRKLAKQAAETRRKLAEKRAKREEKAAKKAGKKAKNKDEGDDAEEADAPPADDDTAST